MATSDFLDVIDQFQAPVLKDSQVEVPEFEEPAPQEAAPQELAPQLLTSILPRSLNISCGTTPPPPPSQSIKDEFMQAIKFAARLPESILLETFNPLHMECAKVLTDVFLKIQLRNLGKAVEYAKTKLNLHLITYALSVALRHRDDALDANIQIPSHICTTPQMYVDITNLTAQVSNEKQQQNAENNSQPKKPVLVNINSNFTATDMDPEHRVAYFREDIAVNLHHRHWHEVYPFSSSAVVVNKDRRGELFYYMHQQVVARYNFERLCNSLPRAIAYDDFRKPINEAYFPKLDSASNTKLWCPRQANIVLKDIERDSFDCKISDMERWRERIFEAIDRGYAYVKNPDGTETMKKLEEPEAINDLGNTLESVPELSWNTTYYGDLHNKGHLFFAYCHDPDYRFREQGSVMSHSETALRDPIFYRWHVFVDDICQSYKRTLKPYTYEDRSFPGITIDEVTVKSEGVNEPNTFKTFWQKDIVDITQGILNRDANKDGPVYAIFSHLQHKDFTYEITVSSEKATPVTGTVRIFLAPKHDESGMSMSFNRQRRLFIELDKFTTTLNPGKNKPIVRKSIESSVTIPFEQSFMTTNEAKIYSEDEELKKALLSYCGCGWPQHLLIGKGNAAGFICSLFVMITDYETDKVEDSSLENKTECCTKSSVSYCGVRNKKYPDKKPMGFPFDRKITDTAANLKEFATKSQISYNERVKQKLPTAEEEHLSNMKITTVKVKFFEGEPVIGPSMRKCNFKENKETIKA